VAASVGDDHDLELEPLRCMDGQEPNRPSTFLLRHRLELLRSERILLADEAHEAGDVRAANGLVVAREPPELAEVRIAATTVPASEDREVVVVLRHDALAQRFQADAGRGADEALVALEESPQKSLVALREVLG